MKTFIAFLAAFILMQPLSGQKTHFQFGLLSAQNESLSITEPDTKHYGYRIGMDTKLVGLGIYLLGGAHYYKYSSAGLNDRDHFQQNGSLQILKARGGLGITPFSITPLIRLRLKALAAYNHLLSGRDQLNTSITRNNYIGWDFGAGLTIGFLTVDIEYEKGFSDLLEKEPSRFDIWSLTAGIQF